jgi:hypothetical protein
MDAWLACTGTATSADKAAYLAMEIDWLKCALIDGNH